MRFSLIPQEEKFFEDFNTQAQLINKGAQLLREFVEDWSANKGHVEEINLIEHECDQIVHSVIVRLNKTFVTPVDREDIHSLASTLDDVLDYIQGAAVRMELFRIQTPTNECIELARTLEKATEVLLKGLQLLPTFGDISVLRKELHAFEKQGDKLYRQALADLFENRPDPLDVIKWKDIYEIIETAIDKC
ncbi:MAG: DUF47 domain-containing protein, partial [Armatimonadetes bacterium]|nr:DUF47 domain-containing protein [Armatimonadota bacterium]